MQYYDIASLASAFHVAPNGINRMVEEGTFPQPVDHLVTSRAGRDGIWSETQLERWFGNLHQGQAAYASVGEDPGLRELDEFGGYACPVQSGYVWARRPGLFAGYTNGTVTVWPVIGFATDEPLFGARSISAIPGSAQDLLDTIRGGRGVDDPLTFFRLDVDNPLGSFTLDNVVRGGGGTVSPDSLRKAIEIGHAVKIAGGHVRWEK